LLSLVVPEQQLFSYEETVASFRNSAANSVASMIPFELAPQFLHVGGPEGIPVIPIVHILMLMHVVNEDVPVIQ
jgi:hypothetical protein